MRKNNIDYINIMRGIAIILVVIGHFNPEYSPAWYKIINEVIYSFHMPLFLLISGYIYSVTYSSGSYTVFVGRKINRLMIPYLSTSIFVITFKLISEQFLMVDNPTTISAYIDMFYINSAGYYLWFIWVLFILFLIVPIFTSKKSRIILALVCLILYFIPYELPGIFCLNQFKQNSVFFVMGMIVYDWKNVFRKVEKCPIYISLLLFLITNVLLHNCDNVVHSIVFLSTALIGTLLIMQVSKKISNAQPPYYKILISLSGASYFIYLFHTTFEGLAKAVIFKMLVFQINDVLFTIGAICVVLVGILIPYILFVLVGKYKLLSFLFGIKHNTGRKSI